MPCMPFGETLTCPSAAPWPRRTSAARSTNSRRRPSIASYIFPTCGSSHRPPTPRPCRCAQGGAHRPASRAAITRALGGRLDQRVEQARVGERPRGATARRARTGATGPRPPRASRRPGRPAGRREPPRVGDALVVERVDHHLVAEDLVAAGCRAPAVPRARRSCSAYRWPGGAGRGRARRAGAGAAARRTPTASSWKPAADREHRQVALQRARAAAGTRRRRDRA